MASLHALQTLKAPTLLANSLREFMYVKEIWTTIKAWEMAGYFPTSVRKNHR